MSTIKLGSLFIKTLTKPVAKQLKAYAKSNKAFRNICFKLAQTAHKAEVNWKLKILGYKPEAVRPLNEQKAVDSGAEFIGEAFIFGVAASIILLETQRQRNVSKKDKQRTEDRLLSLETLPEKIDRLQETVSKLNGDFNSAASDIEQLRSIVSDVVSAELRKFMNDNN